MANGSGLSYCSRWSFNGPFFLPLFSPPLLPHIGKTTTLYNAFFLFLFFPIFMVTASLNRETLVRLLQSDSIYRNKKRHFQHNLFPNGIVQQQQSLITNIRCVVANKQDDTTKKSWEENCYLTIPLHQKSPFSFFFLKFCCWLLLLFRNCVCKGSSYRQFPFQLDDPLVYNLISQFTLVVSEIHVLFGARQVLSSFSFRILEMLGKQLKEKNSFVFVEADGACVK